MVSAYASQPVHLSCTVTWFVEANHSLITSYTRVVKFWSLIEQKLCIPRRLNLVLSNTHLCKWLDIRISRKVVDEMSRKDVLTWTAMIFWYTRVGDITKAALLFEAMPDRDAAARSD